jgi:hypothetical protein
VFTSIQENMTLVTAYFDLGRLRKGGGINKQGYMNWATKAYLACCVAEYAGMMVFGLCFG